MWLASQRVLPSKAELRLRHAWPFVPGEHRGTMWWHLSSQERWSKDYTALTASGAGLPGSRGASLATSSNCREHDVSCPLAGATLQHARAIPKLIHPAC
jgi:hypothetical protein